MTGDLLLETKAAVDRVEAKLDALLEAMGARVVEEPVDPLAAGFREFAEESARRHSPKER